MTQKKRTDARFMSPAVIDQRNHKWIILLKDTEKCDCMYLGLSCQWINIIDESGDMSLNATDIDGKNPRKIH